MAGFFFEGVLKTLELLDDFGLFEGGLFEFGDVEVVGFGEVGDGAVGYGDAFFGGYFFGEALLGEFGAEFGVAFGVVVVVFYGDDIEEVAVPEVGAVAGFIEAVDGEAVVGVVLDDEGAFVDLIGVDALLGLEGEVAGIVYGDLEEGDFALGFDDAEGVDVFASGGDAGDERGAEVAGFDVWVVGLGEEVLGDVGSVFDEGIGVFRFFEDGFGVAVDFVGGDIGVVVEVVGLVRFEGFQETVGEQLGVFSGEAAEGLAGLEGLLFERITDFGERHGFELGGIEGNG